MNKETVVDAICAGLKLPGLGETVERAAVTRAVSAAYDHVPVFVWEIVMSATDGLDVSEIDSLLASMSKTIAARVKMPYLPEVIREQVVSQMLAMLRSALQVDDYIEALAK